MINIKINTISSIWRKYPDFKRLQMSSIFTGLGSWISFIGMLVLLDKITQNGIQLGLLWSISGLAPILFSLFTGVFVDRVNIRKFIVLADFLNAMLFLVYIFVPQLDMKISWVLFFVIRFIIGISNSFSSIASQKVVKNIVNEEDLVAANSLSYTITSVIRLTGASIGGLVISFFPLEIAWIIASFLYLISAVNIYLCNWKLSEKIKTEKNFKEEFITGLKVVQQNKLVGIVLISAFSMGIIIGTFNLMLQQYVTNIYEMQNYGISILYCAEGFIAIIVGYKIAQKKFMLSNKINYSFIYGMIGLGWILFGFTNGIYQGILALIIFSIGAAILAPFERYIMQTQVPENLQGRVFGLWNTVTLAAIQLGALLTGIIIEGLGIRFVPLISGTLEILTGIIFFIILGVRHTKNSENLS